MKTLIKSLIFLLFAAFFIMPANAALQAVGPVSASNGFPIWYQDTTGLTLDLCLAGPDGLADPNCLLPTVPPLEPNYDPTLPIVFPTNYPSEAFYGYADSLMDIRSSDPKRPGIALLVLGLEAAFATGDPAPDQQIVFGRVRIRIDAPVAGTYKVTHPYGVDTFTVTAPGRRAIGFTEDIGMVPFSNALTSRHGPFLKAVSPAPPAGYIGNPNVLQTITGSPFGTNYFRIDGPAGSNLDGAGNDFIQTDQFTVQGRIFKGPIITGFAPASPVSDTAGASRTFNITVDKVVNVTWYINGNLVETDTNVTLANYTNTSAVPGTWNVSAVAQNAFGSATQTWTWVVAATGAPAVISSTPLSPAINAAGEARLFSVSFDQVVDVTWSINGVPVQTETGVNQTTYINTSAVIGTWDVSAVAQNANGTVTKSWVWEVTMPINPANGFPLWYQDTTGLKLDQCLAGPDGLADPKCVLPTALPLEPNYNPALPIVFPGNFPSESFYWSADNVIDLQGGGRARLVLALEGAFGGAGDPAPDQQIVFGRVRILIDAPVAGTYTVTHPYGVDTFNVTTPGVRAVFFTEDIGCLGGPCGLNFRQALKSRIKPFLRAVSPAPPAGYIGDPAILQTVTGSPFGTNFFSIAGPAGADLDPAPGIQNTIQSDLFTLSGRIFNDTAAAAPVEVPLQIVAGTTTTAVTATSPSGGVTLTVPAGTNITDAAGTSVTSLNVTIGSITSLPLNAGAALTGDQGIVGEIVGLGPAGTVFNPPITVRFNYTDAQLAAAGINATSLKVMFFNTTTNAWEAVPTTVDQVGKFVTATISHFSTFGLVGTLPQVTTGAIAGTVTDASTGAPIAGATVTGGLAEAITDATGDYRIANLAAGTYTVTATRPGFVTNTTAVTVAAGATTVQDFMLQPVLSEARVNTTLIVSGLPPGANVQFIMNGGVPVFAVADASGTARYLPLLEGSLEIIATKDGAVVYKVTVTVLPEKPVLKSITVSPSTATLFVGNMQTFTALAKDQSGKPIAVTVSWSSSNTTVGTISSAGVFTAKAAGITTITAANGSVSGTATANVAKQIMTISEARVNTTLIVSGLPPGAEVEFILNGGIPVFAIADAAGTAKYLPLVEGSLEIIVRQNGAIIARATVTVLPEVIPVLNGTIAGTVTNASSGAPIAGATVIAGSMTATTDAAGNYSISIAPGTYTVTASAAGFVTQNVPGVAVASGATTTRNFALSPVIQPPVIQPINVTIEVRDNINPRAQGVVRVAILNNTPQGFDVATIDIPTIRFGQAEVVKNVTEGNNDLLLHFNVQDTGIECGDTQVTLTGKTKSGQDIVGTANIVTVGCKAEEGKVGEDNRGKGGGGSGGGTGGGGVTTDEPFDNIEKAERHEKALVANTPVPYDFATHEHGVEQIVITASENENDVALRIEVLKGTAKAVTATPPGTLYKNLNIIAGTKRIKQAVIKFRVENTWMQKNNLAAGDMKMLRWDGSKWVQLETKETSNDGTYTRFEATTTNFSNFAIAGSKAEAAPPAVAITETPAPPVKSPVAAVPTPKAAGFEVVLSIAALCALYVLWRKRR